MNDEQWWLWEHFEMAKGGVAYGICYYTKETECYSVRVEMNGYEYTEEWEYSSELPPSEGDHVDVDMELSRKVAQTLLKEMETMV